MAGPGDDGHAACQRVFWLCDFVGERGVETTPFPGVGNYCSGDDDIEHPVEAATLVEALDSTFGIMEGAWTDGRGHARGGDPPPRIRPGLDPYPRLGSPTVVSYDVYHCGEL